MCTRRTCEGSPTLLLLDDDEGLGPARATSGGSLQVNLLRGSVGLLAVHHNSRETWDGRTRLYAAMCLSPQVHATVEQIAALAEDDEQIDSMRTTQCLRSSRLLHILCTSRQHADPDAEVIGMRVEGPQGRGTESIRLDPIIGGRRDQTLFLFRFEQKSSTV
nr:hypothetical protein CFP56_33795 [Quercus suber]